MAAGKIEEWGCLKILENRSIKLGLGVLGTHGLLHCFFTGTADLLDGIGHGVENGAMDPSMSRMIERGSILGNHIIKIPGAFVVGGGSN